MSRRTAQLTRLDLDRDGVDSLSIGDWLHLEAMGSGEYDLHIGKRQYAIRVPRRGDVQVTEVER